MSTPVADVPIERIVGAKEVCAILGVHKRTLGRWREEGYFPEPMRQLASGPLWDREVVEAFKTRRDERTDGAGRRPAVTG